LNPQRSGHVRRARKVTQLTFLIPKLPSADNEYTPAQCRVVAPERSSGRGQERQHRRAIQHGRWVRV